MIYIKVKQNENWKNLLGPDYSIFKGYTILTPGMVSGSIGTSSQRYIGTATHLIIDDNFPTKMLDRLFSGNQTIISLVILTNKFTSSGNLFSNVGTQLRKIFINTSNMTDMYNMFSSSSATSLDLSSFDTSNVTNMNRMFNGSEATTLDLSSFDTSNVTNMDYMFSNMLVTTLDLSSFDTSKVTNMDGMFQSSLATTLNLSSFDTSNVTNMDSMFYGSSATVGYARTQADADKFNASSYKPAALNFIVKP